MKTIEKLCRNKDVVNLIYIHLHKLLTTKLIKEYNDLSLEDFTYISGASRIMISQGFHFVYREKYDNKSCFNWRKKKYEHNIFHVSIKEKMFFDTGILYKNDINYY